jgi:hypothetical protein
VRALEESGATSVPALSEGLRGTLLQESSRLPFRSASGQVGSYGVEQEMAVCNEIPAPSTLRDAAAAIEEALRKLIRNGAGSCDDDEAFTFNELVLQRYPAGSSGISPHRDGTRFRCVIGILVLSGTGTFAVCRDRAGTDPLPVDARPGRLVLLRAPGFNGMEERPFHSVSDVTEERVVMTLRYDRRVQQRPAQD